MSCRAHILKDLRPYICTYEECEISSQLYDSFGDWFNHEFTHHYKKSNSSKIDMAIKSERRRLICDSDLQQSRECPFCFEGLSTMELAARHIAVHLIRIALFALPRSTGIEVEQDSRSVVSHENAALSEWTEPEGLNLADSDSMSFDNQSLRPQSRTSSIAHNDDDAHGSTKLIQETATLAFPHEDPRNPVPPEVMAQVTANFIKDRERLIHEQERRQKIEHALRKGDRAARDADRVAREEGRRRAYAEREAEHIRDQTHREAKRNSDLERERLRLEVENRLRAGEKSPEDFALPVREGPAPLTDAEKRGIPPTARWTRIARKLVNPEALDTGNERYEEMGDHIIVLRVLTKDMIQAYALKTEEIRAKRDRPKDSSSHS